MKIIAGGKTMILSLNGENAPEWIQLLPPGEIVSGRDGRKWKNPNPAAVVAAFEANMAPIPIDYEHSTMLKPKVGEPAPAAGWVEKMEVRDGSIWGNARWTPKAAEMVKNGEYRFVSPVLVYEKKSGVIVAIDSIGLTNKHNLHLAALNAQQEEDMDWSELLKLLGLSSDATPEQASNAIKRLQTDLATARNTQNPPALEKFVPRADYDLACQRAANAEAAIKATADATLKTEIENEVNAAVKAGKITPATSDYYKGQCRLEGGIEAFKKFVAVAPVIGAVSSLENKGAQDAGLSLDMNRAAEIAGMFGNSAEDLKKYAA